MKKNHYVVVLAVVLTVAGCGSGGTSGNGGSSSGGGGGNVSITGTLGTGSLASISTVKGAAAKADSPAADYTVALVDNSRNKIYKATTDANGAFSVEVPSGTTYLIGLINSSSYVGPVIFDGEGTQVNTAIEPTTAADLGSITVDTGNGYARTATPPSEVDEDILAEASNGKPLGAGPDNDGKLQNAGITNRTDSDEDKDGIPNLFDADEDNDGIRNGITSRASGATVVSDNIEAVFMSSNIWFEHGSTTTGSTQAEIAAQQIAMRFHVIPKSGKESLISSVQCVSVPTSIASVATVRWASSLGNPSGYPAEHSLWSTAGYGLYRTTDTVQFPQEEWIVSIKPVGVMSVGDLFTIRVTYTDSTYEDFFITMPYIMTDWARVSTYNGTTLTAASGSKTNPQTFSADNLEVIFFKPLDEDGNVLAGLSYSVIYGISDCTGGTCSVPNSSSSVNVTDTGGATLTATVPTSSNGTYYITPTASSSDGQSNGEETWFTRQ